MLRKLLMIGAVIVVPLGTAVTTGAPAWAGVNASTKTAKCGAITAAATFSHVLTTGGFVVSGAPYTLTTTLSATLTSCTSTATGVTISKGTLSGTYKTVTAVGQTAARCTSLNVPTAGTGRVTVRWTTNTPLVSQTSTVLFNRETFTVAPATPHVLLSIPAGGTIGVSGSFGGGNHGATSSIVAKSTLTVAVIATKCGGVGLAGLDLTTPTSPTVAATFR
jgi:hypothetical protein